MPNICKCGCLRPCGTQEYAPRHATQRTTRIDSVLDLAIGDLQLEGQRAEPDHLCRLELVPQTENIRRGLVPTLTKEQAKAVGDLYLAGNSQYAIGRLSGPSGYRISRILSGAQWHGIVGVIPARRESNLKLSPGQADEIRQRVFAGETQRDLASVFGIGQSQISRIVRRESWATATTRAN